ncbi:Pathogen-associated molecular patterns-induced protein A70 [Sesamum angolense]|uniref:Pathogen-associated molecular patterns-induced protein A70 n=1 Tax=Sesamum angolense TaxID=2727404 RepID=A0AAE1W8L4_9LAMI|nr:Pathogen-associated molecular patterns-induced protein A70 [Sesamum angolense]
MLQESAAAASASIWASINSWLTPTLLFLLLNLMIATIAFTSSLANHKHSQNHQHIAKPPSLLHRLKSINFSTQQPLISSPSPPDKPNTDSETLFDEAHEQETQTHVVSEERDDDDDVQQAREEEVVVPDENIEQSMDVDVHGQMTGSGFSRTKSDTQPASGEVPTKLPARMRKSASLKSAFAHFEEEDIVEARRPATVREKGSGKVTEGDEEVDAKADDFINRFKQQLKLQRLDSIIRYKDMIGRGGR